MKKYKIVFVVYGSEDGILGVYGNKKQAYREAVDYVYNSFQGSLYKVESYSKVCNELKNIYDYGIDIIDHHRTDINASINAILFNKNTKETKWTY